MISSTPAVGDLNWSLAALATVLGARTLTVEKPSLGMDIKDGHVN